MIGVWPLSNRDRCVLGIFRHFAACAVVVSDNISLKKSFGCGGVYFFMATSFLLHCNILAFHHYPTKQVVLSKCCVLVRLALRWCSHYPLWLDISPVRALGVLRLGSVNSSVYSAPQGVLVAFSGCGKCSKIAVTIFSVNALVIIFSDKWRGDCSFGVHFAVPFLPAN